MALDFQENGNIVAGIHTLTIDELELIFGFNEHRRKLITGLKKGMAHLLNCRCRKIYIDGSFCSKKELPSDFDVCWDWDGVDIAKLQKDYPHLVDFENERKNQKTHYLGEFFPAQTKASPHDIFLTFFQKDKDDNPKGIILINLT